jgi:hypothetical protein
MILEAGLKIVELEFPDGSSPPKAVIKKWLKIVLDQFGEPSRSKKPSDQVKLKIIAGNSHGHLKTASGSFGFAVRSGDKNQQN